jgi:hypothetical protein
MIKFNCDIDGLKDNFIGMSETWTQKESKAAEAAMSGGWTNYLAFLSTKVEACNLVTGNETITDFVNVTEEALDNMDLRLVGFIGGMVQQTVARLRALGNVSARVLSSTNGGKN